jgi:hypothetical protein
MIKLIILSHIGFIWGMMLFTNYISFRIPFLDYPSVMNPTAT